MKAKVEVQGIEFEVEFEHVYQRGDYETEPLDYIEIYGIELAGEEMSGILKPEIIDEIKEEIMNKIRR